MRKVVTGDQVAQIYNRDPLAFPIWRAPVYRTPGWIIAIAQLCRFICLADPAGGPAPGRVASSGGARVHLDRNRLARRDPPGGLGGAGPGCLAGAVAGVVRPPGGCPGAQQVAGVAVPAPVGVGDDDLRAGPLVSGPDHPAGARQGPLHPLRRPGAGPARLRPVGRPGRRRRRQPGPRVRRDPVPGPHRPVRCGAAGVRPPRRPRPGGPARPDPGLPRPAGTGSRPPRGRAAVAGAAARHPRPGGGRHRRRARRRCCGAWSAPCPR